MSATTTPAPTYTANERVLCYHGPLIYEAKVLKVQIHDEATSPSGVAGPHYLVHYKGWKQTWDEWVPPSRLLKYTEPNQALQKSLHANASSANASTSKANKSAAKDSGSVSIRAGARKDGTRGTKRGREEDESAKKPDIKLNIPEVLKAVLVDDWEAVTKNNQIVPLPRSPTVEQLLNEFGDYVINMKPPHLRDPALLVPTIISGFQLYFDRALGMTLLYRFERPQYAKIRKQYWTGPKVVVGTEKEMSTIYGAEHLLRMLVNLPQLIASSNLDAESVLLVRDYANELLQYMAKERHRIFLQEYESASLQYQNVSRS